MLSGGSISNNKNAKTGSEVQNKDNNGNFFLNKNKNYLRKKKKKMNFWAIL
jgi:hypothetical protein